MNKEEQLIYEAEQRVALDILQAIESYNAYYEDVELEKIMNEKAMKYHLLDEKGNKLLGDN